MIRVLYVDDEKSLLDLTKTFLELSGVLQVDTSISVKDAEVKALRTGYDAIIADYQMPEMNGIEFLKRLRSRNCTTPFILFTGRGREEVVIEAMNSGVDSYIQKGGKPQAQFAELEHRVKEAVRRSRAERALHENEERLTRAQAISHSGSWELTWNGNKVQIWGSEESFRIFGHPRPSNGISPSELVTACIVDKERVHQAFLDLIERGTEYDLEYEIAPANGRPNRVVHSVAELVRDPEGRPLKMIGVIQDITEHKKAEKALQGSQQLLRAVLDNIQQVVVWKDRELRIAGCNKKAATDLGFSDPEELIGKTDHDVLTRQSADAYSAKDLQVMETGVPFIDLEEKLQRYDGVQRWLRISKVPLRDPEGSIIGIMDACEDITERNRTKEALRESEERYWRLIESIPDCIIEMDLDGNITSVNSRVPEISGYSKSEIIGKSIYSFIAPEDVENAIKNMAAMVHGRMGPNKYDMIFKGGRRRTMEANGDVLRGTDGSVQGIVIVGRDITNHEVVEEELRARKIQLTMAMDMTRLAYWEYDIDADVYTFNDQFYTLYGTSADREGGYLMTRERYVHEFIHPDDVGLFKEMYERASSLSDSECHLQHHVHRIVRRDGEVRFITVSFCRTSDGRATKVFGASQDITDQKMTEESLKKANEKLNLLYNINRHDILNQLMVQRGYLGLARDHVSDTYVLRNMQRIDDSITVVQKHIEFARDCEMIGAVSPQWQSVRETVCNLPDLERVERLEIEDGVGDLRVWADPLLSKVFHNLVENTIKYCGQAVDIRIGCVEDKKDLLLIYEDKGNGIPEDEKGKIFQKGFGKGTGLGLFFSREILAITGITLEEKGHPGKGVRFEMRVPRGHYRFNGNGDADISIPGTDYIPVSHNHISAGGDTVEKVAFGFRPYMTVMPAVLVGANVGGKANYMTVAWTGVACMDPPMIAIAINKTRHTEQGIIENGTFSLNIPSSKNVVEMDYCGLASGRKVDKSDIFETTYGKLGTAPMIANFPVNVECELRHTLELGSHNLHIGEVVDVYMAKDCMTKGIPDPKKIDPIIYSGYNYYRLGEVVGKAFTAGKGFRK